MKLKTKQIVITITSIIVIIITLFAAYAFGSGIINSEEIQIEGAEIPTISNNVQVILLCILALINLIIIFLCRNLVKYKIAMIVLYAIQGLLGGIQNIIAAAIGIPILCIKTQGITEEKTKKSLPVLEEIKPKAKWIYILTWIVIFLVAYTSLINYIIPENANPIIRIALIIGIYIFQIVTLVVLMKENLKRDFIAFKKNFKTYLPYILSRFGVFVLVYLVAAVITVLLVKNISTNQQVINSLPILVTAIFSIILAPFMEELMFRGIVKKVINNKIAFIVISSIIFGGAHVMFAEENLINYFYIVPYTVIGVFLASLYEKTDNIFTNMFAHCMWNTVVFIITAATSLM